MASIPSIDLREQVASILAIAAKFQEKLSNVNTAQQSLVQDDSIKHIDDCLGALPLFATLPPPSLRRQLDINGTKLWNISTQFMAACTDELQLKGLTKVKALAFAMLECAAPNHEQGNYRCLELALKAVRACVEQRQLHLSQKIIEIAAARLDALSGIGDDEKRIQNFTAEYYTLRIHLSWLQGRPDIAEHLFSKISNETGHERIMDVCYEQGVQALLSYHHEMAVRWLERAFDSCESIEKDTQQAKEHLMRKKYLISTMFARASLHLDFVDTNDHLSKALRGLRSVNQDFDALALQLEILSKYGVSDYEEYIKIINAALISMRLEETDIKVVLFFIHKIRHQRSELFLKTIKVLLYDKLASSIQKVWAERVFISLVWALIQSEPHTHCDFDIFEDATQKLFKLWQEPLSEVATNACLILIWKVIDTAMSKKDHSSAGKYCRLLLEQPLFDINSDSKEKLMSTFLLCALTGTDKQNVSYIWDQYCGSNNQSPRTLYLMFKLALRDGDCHLGFAFLRSLGRMGAEARKPLLSCVTEARHEGNSRMASESLRKILESPDNDQLEAVHIPVLYHVEADPLLILTPMITILDRALMEALKEEENIQFSLADLEWLAKTSYNAALRLRKKGCSEQTLHLLELGTKFVHLGSHKTVAEEESSIRELGLCCEFFLSIHLVTESRSQSHDRAKDSYSRLRKSVQHFEALGQGQLRTHNTTADQSRLLHKQRVMHSFDFEAAVSLEQWDDIPRIIDKVNPIIDNKLCSVLMDYILRSAASASNKVQIVKHIICTFHTSPSSSLNPKTFRRMLPQYLRCLFQLAIDGLDFPLAETVLDQAIFLASDNSHVPDSDSRYPREELEWLATTAFNRAVEFYLASADEDCRRWAESAVALADLVKVDGGALGRLLRDNFAKLS